jgi:hypothetical protein
MRRGPGLTQPNPSHATSYIADGRRPVYLTVPMFVVGSLGVTFVCTVPGLLDVRRRGRWPQVRIISADDTGIGVFTVYYTKIRGTYGLF